jgi:TRAP-type mannitol/chloroaromatic compound transport system substrate-binding protein
MIRRNFLKGVGVAGLATAAAAGSFPTPAIAQGGKQLRMMTAWPRNSLGLGTSVDRFAKRVAAMSDGALTIRVFAAGELAPLFKELEKVSSGEADMYHSFDSYYQTSSKAFNFFSGVPFGLNAAEHAAWIRFGGGREVWDELGKNFGVKAFMAGSTGMQMGGWYNKEVRSLADYKGLQIRIAGLGAEVVRKLGGTTVSLPGNEIFPALQSGAIHACEWFGPWIDLAYGLYKVAKFYYYPGFQEPTSTMSLGIGLKTWESLSAQHKAIIEAAADAENDAVLAEFNAKNAEALNILMTKHKITMRRFSDEIMKALGEVSGDVIAEAGNSDEISRKVYDSFLKFRRNAVVYTKVTEQAYGDARLLPFRYGKS